QRARQRSASHKPPHKKHAGYDTKTAIGETIVRKIKHRLIGQCSERSNANSIAAASSTSIEYGFASQACHRSRSDTATRSTAQNAPRGGKRRAAVAANSGDVAQDARNGIRRSAIVLSPSINTTARSSQRNSGGAASFQSSGPRSSAKSWRNTLTI